MVSFLPTSSDKIKKYKKKFPFLFKQASPLSLPYLEARLINSAVWKASTDWQPCDLNYFKIKFENVTNFKDFFNEEMPSYDGFNEQIKEFINCGHIIHINPLTQQKIDWSVIFKSSLARNVIKNLMMIDFYNNDLSVVDDLSYSLLQLFDYDANGHVIHYHKDVIPEPFVKGQQYLYAFVPNISIRCMNRNRVKFVQENNVNDYKHLEHDFSDPYIHPKRIKYVADTIAACVNNYHKGFSYNKPENFKYGHWVPGIIMFKTRPMFLLMNMTEDLLFSVGKGEPSLKETIVKQYLVPPPESYSSEITKGLRDQRLHIASCYKAFRKFVM
ncbi:hypothetical protein BJ944DRAFT_228567 [Cunninghamella echinulata]|nr:hypothetical protein BJ944DRAFT_228567 [Cunninghamella echinulata]